MSAELEQLREQNATLTAEVERLTSELEIVVGLSKFANAPCGHSERYCETEDGGAHITCLKCDIERLNKRVRVPKDIPKYNTPPAFCPECDGRDFITAGDKFVCHTCYLIGALDTAEQDNERLKGELARKDCCGDAHFELEVAMAHITALGFEKEVTSPTETIWRNKRAESAEQALQVARKALRELGQHRVYCPSVPQTPDGQKLTEWEDGDEDDCVCGLATALGLENGGTK